MTDITRTEDEIVARIDQVAGRDMFGVERSRFLESLSYERAKNFLEDDAPHTAESWEQQRCKTQEQVREQILDYLEFSWVKANGCRGNSAHRSIAHFRGLLWLLGDQVSEVLEFFEDLSNYAYYGKPHLVRVSELVSFSWKDHDNDAWLNMEGDEPLTAAAALGR